MRLTCDMHIIETDEFLRLFVSLHFCQLQRWISSGVIEICPDCNYRRGVQIFTVICQGGAHVTPRSHSSSSLLVARGPSRVRGR